MVNMADAENNSVTNQTEDGKLCPGSLTESSRAIRRLDNFWYHHKWKVIVALFFLIVLAVGLVQIFSRVEYDVYVTVAVPYTMNSEENAELSELLQKFCSEDYNGDGDVRVYVQGYQVYSDEEYESEKAYWEAQGEKFRINSAYNQNQISSFDQYLMNGQSTLLLLSPYMYETKKDNGHLLPLSEVFGSDSLPDGTLEDGYGVRLSDTDFYRYNPAAQILPADTILCLHAPVLSLTSGEKYDDSAARELFRAIVDYKVKE
jgi:hypothetical protein